MAQYFSENNKKKPIAQASSSADRRAPSARSVAGRQTTGRISTGCPNRVAETTPSQSRGSSRTANPSARVSAPVSSRKATIPQHKNSASSQGRQGGAGSQSGFITPSLWTKDAPRSTEQKSLPKRMLLALGGLLLSIVLIVGKALSWVARQFTYLVSQNRIARIAAILVFVLGVGALIDYGVNWGKAYAGVHIGKIDVTGKTAAEIQFLVEQTYAEKLAQGKVVIYANKDAAARVADEVAQAEDAALAEQLSAEEARANKQLWTADVASLGASLPSDVLATEALAIGRDKGGVFSRIGAFFGGENIDMRALYNPELLEALASDIDATIGNPRVDFNIAVSEGRAKVTEGHDGQMVNRETFVSLIDQGFFSDSEEKRSFVAQAEYAPLRIDQATAQQTCNEVNTAIADGIRFTYKDISWESDAVSTGNWVATSIEQDAGKWKLSAYLAENHAKSAILTHLQENQSGSSFKVMMESRNNNLVIKTDGVGEIPLVSETVEAANNALFGEGGKARLSQANSSDISSLSTEGQPINISVVGGTPPAESTFEEALSMGIISEISAYTTEYSSGFGTENRNHNIHLVSDLLTNSIVKPDDTWSFNGTAGECNTERGFLGAGAIIAGEYTDAVGGGICQVATTVFNSVYEAGFPVISRRNHSLYIASYPAGRDAAVSWPDLDLVWKNDSSSDVVMRTSYTDTSVTISLYGINPDYRVTSVVGKWNEGASFSTKTIHEDSLAPGRSYIKVSGTNGKSIAVYRTVTSADGSMLHEDPFYSTYDPVNEVKVVGPEVS